MPFAPATEVIITAQFETPFAPMNALDIAEVYRAFESDFPSFKHVPVAGPMAYNLRQLDGSEPVDVVINQMPRISLEKADGSRSILFQQDRFSYGWSRQFGPKVPHEYPGFEALLSEFEVFFGRFTTLLENKADGLDQVRVAEIAYVNAFRTRDDDGEKRRLSSIYRFLNGDNMTGGVNGYQHTWNERLDVADGVLVVQVYGPVVTQDNLPTSVMTLTATFAVADGPLSLSAQLLAVRRRVGLSFNTIIHPERISSY